MNTLKAKSGMWLVTIIIIALAAAGLFWVWQQVKELQPSAQLPVTPPAENINTAEWETYRNETYGFELAMSESWKGYSVIEEVWNGAEYQKEPPIAHSGPLVIIRHPQWSAEKPWQDIPIMVFTPEQWVLIEREELNISAAPIGPMKLDQNEKYIFALPPRWVGFTDALGQQEAQAVAATLKAIPAPTE